MAIMDTREEESKKDDYKTPLHRLPPDVLWKSWGVAKKQCTATIPWFAVYPNFGLSPKKTFFTPPSSKTINGSYCT